MKNYFSTSEHASEKCFRNFLLVIGLLLSLHKFSAAQDVIIKLNRDSINTKVIEVGPDLIRFQKNKNDVLVTKVIDRRDVYMIKYENGKADTISGKRYSSAPIPKTNQTKIKSDMMPGNGWVYFTVSDLFFHQISGGIMYTVPGGYVSFEVPISFGMVQLGLIDTVTSSGTNDYYADEQRGYYNQDKIYSTGFSINVYPAPKHKVRFFCNLSYSTGQYKYTDYDYNYPHGGYDSKERTGKYNSIFTKVGVRFLPTKHINFSFNIGPGFTESQTNDNEYDHNVFTEIQGGIHVGYCF